MRVLVTGATGVLGRRVLPLLSADGHRVTAVSRGRPEQVREAGADPVELDLFAPDAVARTVEGHDAVLDLATRIPSTNRMPLPWAWKDNDRLRSAAARNVADAAITVGARYVRESFALACADGGDAWVDEDAPLDPAVNTRTVVDAEDAAARVTDADGVGVALRFALFYGPDSPQTRDQLATARRGIAPVLGDPAGFQPHVHLDDAARAVVAALDVPAGVYNVVEDRPLRRRELVEVFEQVVGRRLRTPPRVLTRFGPMRTLGRSVRLDNAKLRAATTWTPTHPSAREGLPVVAEESS